jgi:hypothetical protein
MTFAPLLEEVDDVPEELHMATLITADRNPLGVFLNGGGYDLLHRTVVPEVNHLCAGRLQNAADNINCGIMAVKKTGCSNKTDLVAGLVWFYVCGHQRPPS